MNLGQPTLIVLVTALGKVYKREKKKPSTFKHHLWRSFARGSLQKQIADYTTDNWPSDKGKQSFFTVIPYDCHWRLGENFANEFVYDQSKERWRFLPAPECIQPQESCLAGWLAGWRVWRRQQLQLYRIELVLYPGAASRKKTMQSRGETWSTILVSL